MILTIPNLLTLLRLLLVPCFLVASFRELWLVALVLFTTAAVTDIFDGMIARRLNQRSKLGAFLDPAADKTMMVAGYLFYTLHHAPAMQIPVWLTFTVFVRDVLLVIFAYLLYTRVEVKSFPPTFAGKASTVIQAVTLGAAIGANAFGPMMVQFAEVMFRVALVITIYSGCGYVRRAERLVLDPAERGA